MYLSYIVMDIELVTKKSLHIHSARERERERDEILHL